MYARLHPADRPWAAIVAAGALLTLFVLGLLLWPAAALAQGLPVAPEGVADYSRLAQAVLEAGTGHQWPLAIALALVLVVSLLRRFGRGLPYVGAYLDHPLVAFLLPSLAAILGALVTSLAAGQPLSLGVVLSALMTGLASNGLFVGGKKVAESKGWTPEPAQAPVAVETKAQALDVLKGPPP